MNLSFPAQSAKTKHFTLGAPRGFSLSSNGERVFFLRSKAGDDPINCLWMIDLTKDKQEQLIFDPANFNQAKSAIPEAEKRRRERAREQASGITTFTIDSAGNIAAFVLNGDLYVMHVGQKPFCVVAGQAAFDPRLSPDGKYVGFVSAGALKVIATQPKSKPRILAQDKNADITWGQADFIAAEEIGRNRGYWWSPDSLAIIASKVDSRPVNDIFIADPANPQAQPAKIKYPAAGTPNTITSLAIINAKNGRKKLVEWNLQDFPYLTDVNWAEQLIITVQSRDQKRLQVLKIDQKTGKSQLNFEQKDKNWVELTPGLPKQLANGELVHTIDDKRRRLAITGKAITPNSMHFCSLNGQLNDGSLIFTAWQDDPKQRHVWALSADNQLQQISQEPGVHAASARGQTCIMREHNLKSHGTKTQIYFVESGKWQEQATVESHAQKPVVVPRPIFHKSKKRQIETALLLPQNYNGKTKLPVLLDPYGGPHAQMVVAGQSAFLESQWFADQGFAVIVADGRGTPGRDIAWEKAIAGDLITPILDDQVETLQSLAATNKNLDLSRVAIRGWSFGGYLAAYAVVRRPDIFKAAIAGAPVTDWRLYDTHYTERYLGDPTSNANAYDKCSLIKEAHKLQQPLMLIHGFADDNVHIANSLQFSAELLAHGKPHQLLTLSNTTHMPTEPQIVENLFKLQLNFLKQL